AAVAAALDRLVARQEAMAAGEGRWVAASRWNAAREAITGQIAAYLAKHPARFGMPKGELKSALKTSVDAALFDAVFDALVASGTLELRGERARPAGAPWEPPRETMAALERLEGELEGAGLAVPETAAWQSKLGAAGVEVLSLGYFLGRLVRVSQELTYTARQLESLRAKLAAHFAKKPAMTVADFKELSGVSRKYAVPLLEHSDRSGWTVRSGDERKAGGRLAGS
ncbi:MAG TPA: SelB C-terminal domain-containing protein, partial [Candidatus Eisenbacteria bacterium]|nr:SelB C-terminal domain-containing protein [Candidatus Eisenbacteria bacterium]